MPYADPEVMKQKQREYYRKNRERLLAEQKELATKKREDPEYIEKRKAIQKKSYAKHKVRIRAEAKIKYKDRGLVQYGLTREDYDRMFEEQKGVCCVCEQPGKPVNNSHRTLVVDHNHTTNKVRGLLCSSCNTGLGMFYDNPRLLHKAATYLKKTNATE